MIVTAGITGRDRTTNRGKGYQWPDGTENYTKIGKMIAIDCHLLFVVGDVDFRRVLKALEPRYTQVVSTTPKPLSQTYVEEWKTKLASFWTVKNKLLALLLIYRAAL